jgi:integrase
MLIEGNVPHLCAGLARPGSAHGIRHSAITECAHQTNGNAVRTQRFGRHKSAQVTMRYMDEHADEFGEAAGLVAAQLRAEPDERT